MVTKMYNFILLQLSFFFTDPNMWTADHVQQWVQWAVREYSLTEVQVSRFTMEGKQLCKMTREDFARLTSSYNADVLLSHLNFLKQGKNTCLYLVSWPVLHRPLRPITTNTIYKTSNSLSCLCVMHNTKRAVKCDIAKIPSVKFI